MPCQHGLSVAVPASPGQPCKAGERPNETGFRTVGAGSMPAVVREIVDLGAGIRVGLESAGGQRLWADLRSAEAAGLEPRVEVSVGWPLEAAIIWEDAENE